MQKCANEWEMSEILHSVLWILGLKICPSPWSPGQPGTAVTPGEDLSRKRFPIQLPFQALQSFLGLLVFGLFLEVWEGSETDRELSPTVWRDRERGSE